MGQLNLVVAVVQRRVEGAVGALVAPARVGDKMAPDLAHDGGAREMRDQFQRKINPRQQPARRNNAPITDQDFAGIYFGLGKTRLQVMFQRPVGGDSAPVQKVRRAKVKGTGAG